MKNISRRVSLILVVLFAVQTMFGWYSFNEISADEIEEINIEENIFNEVISPDAADIIAPVADLSTLEVSQKTAVPGDMVTIKVKASDEQSGIYRIFFSLKNENGGSYLKSVYNTDEEGYYSLNFSVNENTHNGAWSLSYFVMYDNNSNEVTYAGWEGHDLSAADFIVENETSDIIAPVADLSTLEVSQKTAVPGDMVTIKVKASDEQSGIYRIFFSLKNENGGSYLKSVYNTDEEGYYSLNFSVNENTHNGAWSLSYFVMYDNNSNEVTYAGWKGHDLSAADFIVENETSDIIAPVADLSTLEVSQKTAVPGDMVTIKVKASDEQSGIYRIFFSLKNENGGSYLKSVYNTDEEGYYSLNFSVNENTHNGTWSLSYFVMYDNNSNEVTYAGWEGHDLSAADFEVIDQTVPENKINAEYITSNTTWNYKMIDHDVYVGPNAILTVDGNVTISGNLYILGAVVSYGDLTVKSIFANSAYYGYSSTINQGSMNFRGGTHTVPNLTVSGRPIPNIPIEVYSDNNVNENRVLPLLEGATLPIGDLYIEGEKVDYYYNGTFSIPDYFVGSKKSLEMKVIDVFGKEHVFTYELNNLNQRELLDYELVSIPEKTEYVVGQNIDLTGIEVAAVYDDGTKESVIITEDQISGFNSSTPVVGQVVTITIGERNLTFLIDIVSKALESIEVTKNPDKLKYIVGQLIDLSGIEVTGTYNDGEKKIETITLENLIGFNSSQAETGQVVTVTVEGAIATFTVDIIPIMLENIEITKQPVRLSYYVGEELDLSGFEVMGSYNNGEKRVETITMENITGFDSSQAEVGQKVTVTVGAEIATFTVDIIPVLLASIEITKQPGRISYFVGETLDLTGLQVTGTYNSGEKRIEPITMENITGFDSRQAETGQIVTVNINGKTATFMVAIVDIVLVSIQITKLPYKHDYYEGEALDLEGLEIMGYYNNYENKILPFTMENITGFDSSEAESGQVVTVTIDGKSSAFTLDIIELRRVYLEITNLPDKLVYYVGEELDLTGLEVTGIYNSGETRILPITMEKITGFDSSQVQSGQIVVVTVGSGNVQFRVDIVPMPKVLYRTHVQTYGWQDYVSDGMVSGTTGKAKRLEGITIMLESYNYDLGVKYSTHVEKIGWQNYVENGDFSGTEGLALRLEAIKIELTGSEADRYDIYYRVHAEKFGWMGWAKNGQAAGTAGYAYRLEAIEINIVKKGENPYPENVSTYRDKNTVKNISYRTHVQSIGWQDFVSDGVMSGTEGRKLRLEGIEISLGDHLPTGSVEYSTHVQSIGWKDNVIDGAMSGTEGRALRLEAIRINLTGEMSRQYDIYYRVHSEKIGWMGWAKNGDSAGTSGYAYRLEGIEIVLVEKGGKTPGSTQDHFRIR